MLASSLLLAGLAALVFGLKLWALIDACTRPAAAFEAAGKLTKPAWLAILVGGLLLHTLNPFNPIGLLSLVGTVAAIVYLVDVKPAVSGMRPGSGPYG